MKKLFIAILLLYHITSLAQNIEFGTGASFTKFKGEVNSAKYGKFEVVNQPQLTFNATVSGNIPLKYIKDDIVLGVNPNAALSLFYSTLAVDMPVFATLKIGAGSSEKSESTLGAGLGVGGQFSVFSTYLNPDFVAQKYSGVMFIPTIMGEASITFQNYNMYQLRIELTPVPVPKNNKVFVGNISQLNIRLIRAFF
jgi:hypothetical protein